jgi:hypothetical protein
VNIICLNQRIRGREIEKETEMESKTVRMGKARVIHYLRFMFLPQLWYQVLHELVFDWDLHDSELHFIVQSQSFLAQLTHSHPARVHHMVPERAKTCRKKQMEMKAQALHELSEPLVHRASIRLQGSTRRTVRLPWTTKSDCRTSGHARQLARRTTKYLTFFIINT